MNGIHALKILSSAKNVNQKLFSNSLKAIWKYPNLYKSLWVWPRLASGATPLTPWTFSPHPEHSQNKPCALQSCQSAQSSEMHQALSLIHSYVCPHLSLHGCPPSLMSMRLSLTTPHPIIILDSACNLARPTCPDPPSSALPQKPGVPQAYLQWFEL